MKTKKSEKSNCSFRLKSLDLAGEMFSFEFPTFSRKLKTKAGSCLTLVIGFVTILATLMIGSKYFDTSSPSITFSNEIGPDLSHNLAKELLVTPITVYLEGAPIKADFSKFATIKAVATTSSFDPVKGGFTQLSYDVIDFVNCKELNDPYYNKLLSKIDEKNRFKESLQCPDFKGNYNLSEVILDTRALWPSFLR